MRFDVGELGRVELVELALGAGLVVDRVVVVADAHPEDVLGDAVDGGHDFGRRQAGLEQDAEDRLDRAQRRRRAQRARGEHRDRARMGEDGRSVGARRLLEPFGERRPRVDARQVDAGHDRLEHEVVERRLVGHVVVGGHGVDPERRAEAAHGERLEALVVDDRHGGLDDALPVERFDVLLAWRHRVPS